MPLSVSPFVLLSFLSAVITAILAVVSWRNRGEPGATWFTAIMVGATLYSTSNGLELLTFDPALKQLLEIPYWFGAEIFTVAFLLFAMEYTGRREYIAPRLIALLSLIPALTVVVVATNSVHGLFWTDYRVVETFGAATSVYDRGPWLLFKSTYGFVLIGTGFLMFLETIFVERDIHRDQAIAILIGGTPAPVAFIMWLLRLGPLPHVDVSPMLWWFQGLLWSYAVFRSDLFKFTPAPRRLGQQAAVDSFSDAVVLLDDEKRVVDANKTAQHLFETDTDDVFGTQIHHLLGQSLDLAKESQTVSLETGGRTRVFEVTASPIDPNADRAIGYTLIFHDITDRQRREQRLEVLNRVLRHNLRNDAQVVQAYAQELTDRLDSQESQLAVQIQHQSAELVEISEKAREIERLLARETDTHSVELATIVGSIVDRIHETYPEAEIEVAVSSGTVIEADSDLLETVLWNVLENAIEHTDSNRPYIEIRSEQVTDTRVAIMVTDNGPGIPDHERTAILEGEETALTHGSGIGLWLIKWGVRTLGGELDITNAADGTRVTISLPLAAETTAYSQ